MTRVELLHSIAYDHTQFREKTGNASKSTALAVSLLVIALIVIVAGCLCLSLKGVNVIRHVIWPAVVPGVAAILISLPLFIRGSKYYALATPFRKRCLEDTQQVLREETHRVFTDPSLAALPKKEQEEKQKDMLRKFMEEHIFTGYFKKPVEWDRNYVTKLMPEIKARYEANVFVLRAEKTLVDHGNQISVSETKDIQAKIEAVKEALKKGVTGEIEAALKELKTKIPDKKADRSPEQTLLFEALDEVVKDLRAKHLADRGKKKKKRVVA